MHCQAIGNAVASSSNREVADHDHANVALRNHHSMEQRIRPYTVQMLPRSHCADKTITRADVYLTLCLQESYTSTAC